MEDKKRNEWVNDDDAAEQEKNQEKYTGTIIISFLIPLVGLILYFAKKNSNPRQANLAGKAAGWGFVFALIVEQISKFV